VNTASKCNLAALKSGSSPRGHAGLENLNLVSFMGFAGFAVKRPFANIASIIPVGLMEVGAGLRRLVFPEIDIPVDF
jgi:hypothetical protein